MKNYYDRFGREWKMSRRFKTERWYDEEGNAVFLAKGSPADIRKMVKIVEADGLIPWNTDKPIFREGRTYGLGVEDSTFYHIFRVA